MEMTFSDRTTYFLYHYPLQVLIFSLHSNPYFNSIQKMFHYNILFLLGFFLVSLSTNTALVYVTSCTGMCLKRLMNKNLTS